MREVTAVKETVVAARGVRAVQGAASLTRVATTSPVIRASTNNSRRPSTCASAPRRAASACLANVVNVVTVVTGVNAVAPRRGYPVTGVTRRSPSPFT